MSRGDFWSRRKAAVAEEEAAVIEAAVSPEPVEEHESEDDLSDAELLEKYDLPDPDTLEEGDDFAQFMGGAVPTRLRNRALRRLWLTNPALANIDGLVDYGEDYTDAATVVENLQTVYQVGKGMVQQLLEDDEDEVALGEDSDDGQQGEHEDQDEPEMTADATESPRDSVEYPDGENRQDNAVDEATGEDEYPLLSQAKPRMRFSFPAEG